MITSGFTFVNEVEQRAQQISNPDSVLGKTLMQPFRPANSGPRALMYTVHVTQSMCVNEAEVPIICTGYEDKFAQYSSSFEEAEHQYQVVAKIYKYSPEYPSHYYLIVYDIDTGEYDYIERSTCVHTSEKYGFMWCNKVLDSLNVGDYIEKGTTIRTSRSYDEYENKENGVNLTTAYIACAQNMEDSIIISETAARKLGSMLISTCEISLNNNDIMLNLYGDDSNYKTFPDIGESVKDGIFCALRRVDNSSILYQMSQNALKKLGISDKAYLIKGIVSDISVRCNTPEMLESSIYNNQIKKYYEYENAFAMKIVNAVRPIVASGYLLSNKLNELYSICSKIISGAKYSKNGETDFNGILLQITTITNLPMRAGDKMCDRYGGKGVVSKVLPDNLMPILDAGNGNWRPVEVIKNQSTCINRENLGQLHEQSLTFIGMRLIDEYKKGYMSPKEFMINYYNFLSIIDIDYADYMTAWFDPTCEYEDSYYNLEIQMFINSIVNEDDCLIISDRPFATKVTMDLISRIYDNLPFIEPYDMYVRIKDSNGNIRSVKAARPMYVGKIYNYRLKQFAEEKFSVTSLSPINTKGLNTRSKAGKNCEEPFTRTPVMLGNMEALNLTHVGIEYVIQLIMLYSASPNARALFEKLLIGDPTNIDIRLDETSVNRNAEIIAALMKTMGMKLEFTKKLKEKKKMCGKIMCEYLPRKMCGIIMCEQIYPQPDVIDYTMRRRMCTLLPQPDVIDYTKPREMCKIIESPED